MVDVVIGYFFCTIREDYSYISSSFGPFISKVNEMPFSVFIISCYGILDTCITNTVHILITVSWEGHDIILRA